MRKGKDERVSRCSNLHFTRGGTLKRVTSGGAHLGLAPGQLSSEETSQWWRIVGDTVLFHRPENRTPTSSANMHLTTALTQLAFLETRQSSGRGKRSR